MFQTIRIAIVRFIRVRLSTLFRGEGAPARSIKRLLPPESQRALPCNYHTEF